ncbi:hypothetical protein [Mucilaginibacter sp. L3T2-6]|uniref:hypothetical protein n=1 Tax=Mucilaginibacter sp. L3T2-6 TaxID=3062491 RepID=UPI002675BB1E|nr:hypothetical protein [Mucilaginibacter sp. L3T2-6]MDO3641315.1 hypothetical protein [Mucilaginibacter sp. L3T2-6]MDV6213925.1 hypothetical protein [Mucilaginibacter sp. L3T2-6]
MKPLTLIIAAVIAVVSGSSCSKEKQTVPAKDITGKWKWVKSQGGISGAALTPKSEGFTQTEIFGADSSFKFYRADKLVSNGRYAVQRNYRIGNQTVDLLKITENNSSAFTVRNDTLYTWDLTINDGYMTIYVRMR